MLELEVLDVDPLSTESLGDRSQDAGPVRHVDAQAMQRARVGIGDLEHAPPVPGRLADPARDEARVAGRERLLELLDPAPVLGERVSQRLRVVEEDVDPDARVGAGDAGHVAERAAGGQERVVPLDFRRTGLVDEQVGERVREVARQRDDPVVRLGVDRDGSRTEPGDECVDEPVALRIRLGQRCQEPRRPLEQLAAGVLRPARLGAAYGMAADEARRSSRARADRRLRRTDVGHRALLGSRREHSRHLTAELRNRCSDDGELGALERVLARLSGLVDGAFLDRALEGVRVGIESDHLRAGPLGSEPDRGADQPGADESDAHGLSRSLCPSA